MTSLSNDNSPEFNLVFYGTLRSQEVLKLVLGDDLFKQISFEEVSVKGSTFYVSGQTYPMLVDTGDDTRSPALIVKNLPREALERLDYYEENLYGAKKIAVFHSDGRQSTAYAYAPSENLVSNGKIWRFEAWQQNHERDFINTIVLPEMNRFVRGKSPCMVPAYDAVMGMGLNTGWLAAQRQNQANGILAEKRIEPGMR